MTNQSQLNTKGSNFSYWFKESANSIFWKNKKWLQTETKKKYNKQTETKETDTKTELNQENRN